MKYQRLNKRSQTGTRSALTLAIGQQLDLVTSETNMKKVREPVELQEPLGIIISRGDRAETRPIFSAYIWGPAPEPVKEATTKVA